MDIFNIISGIVSILSFIISLFAFKNVINIKKELNQKINQNVQGEKINNINQNNKSGDNKAEIHG